MASLFVDDGFVWDWDCPARGVFPAVRGRVRPALPSATYVYLHDAQVSGAARFEATVRLLDAQAVSWDVTDAQGAPVPVTAANLRRCPMHVLEAMLAVALSYGPERQERAEKNS